MNYNSDTQGHDTYPRLPVFAQMLSSTFRRSHNCEKPNQAGDCWAVRATFRKASCAPIPFHPRTPLWEFSISSACGSRTVNCRLHSARAPSKLREFPDTIDVLTARITTSSSRPLRARFNWNVGRTRAGPEMDVSVSMLIRCRTTARKSPHKSVQFGMRNRNTIKCSAGRST